MGLYITTMIEINRAVHHEPVEGSGADLLSITPRLKTAHPSNC